MAEYIVKKSIEAKSIVEAIRSANRKGRIVEVYENQLDEEEKSVGFNNSNT